MAITRIKGKQLEASSTGGALLVSDTSNNFVVKNPTTGADTIWFYDSSAGDTVQLTIGTNLSITGTTLNASAGAGGYAEVQEEGSALTARTKINFIGSAFTASDDAGNTRTNVSAATFLNTLATAGSVSLTAHVSGILPHANGGTGFATYAVGDLLYANTTSSLARLADVATGSVLKSGGVGVAPAWGTLASTDLTNSSNIALLNGTQTISGTYTFSNNITLNGTPSANTDVTNVLFVNNAISTALAGLRKGSVRVATTTAGTLASSFANGSVVDGITLATGNLILIKNQSTQAENGVYTVNASGAPTRATWMDSAAEIDGVYVAVEDGTANAGTLWITVSEVTTLGTDPITFTQIQTSGAVSSVTVTQPAAGITVTNSGVAQTGATTSTIALANDLAAIEALASNGIATRTATDTWTVRTMTGTANRITVTNGDGVSGNPTFDIAATYVGQTSITTLGTIGTGTWQGTTVASGFGGTGFSTYAAGDIIYASATNTLSKLGIGSNGQVLTVSGGTLAWGSNGVVTRAYLTGSTASVIDLDSGTAVTDLDGNNIAFTVPTDLDLVFVVRNGVVLSRSGTVSRDYTLVSATGVLTLASALTTDESLMVYKIV